MVDKERVIQQLEDIVSENPLDKRYDLVPEAIRLIKEGYSTPDELSTSDEKSQNIQTL